jgi:putative MATE family efflux protein
VIGGALGRGEHEAVRRTTTHAILLAVAIVLVLATVGWWTINPLFSALGAKGIVLTYIGEYMRPWYAAVGFLIVPLIGNSALRATGDARTPSRIMIGAGLVNVVLDPFLIFGIGPFPAWGMFGAAIATVLAWATAFLIAAWVLVRRDHMVAIGRGSLTGLLGSWRAILAVGLPAAASSTLQPVTQGIVTRFVAAEGPVAVAAFGVGSRVDSLASVGMAAMATAAVTFAAQNLGAGRPDRLRLGHAFGLRFSLVWGGAGAILLATTAPWWSRLFSDEVGVQQGVVAYARIVTSALAAVGYGLVGAAFLQGMRHSWSALLMVVARVALLVVPGVWLGGRLLDRHGTFLGLGAALLAGGVLTWLWLRAALHRLDPPE